MESDLTVSPLTPRSSPPPWLLIATLSYDTSLKIVDWCYNYNVYTFVVFYSRIADRASG